MPDTSSSRAAASRVRPMPPADSESPVNSMPAQRVDGVARQLDHFHADPAEIEPVAVLGVPGG
jgi:hypothetical protein